MRRSLMAVLVCNARDRGDCSTEQLANLAGRSSRAVRYALDAEETPPEQLHRLHCQSATPSERRAMVEDYARLIGADVAVIRGTAADQAAKKQKK